MIILVMILIILVMILVMILNYSDYDSGYDSDYDSDYSGYSGCDSGYDSSYDSAYSGLAIKNRHALVSPFFLSESDYLWPSLILCLCRLPPSPTFWGFEVESFDTSGHFSQPCL